MPLIIPAIHNLTAGRAATPIAFINAILMGYRKYGIDSANVLALARISRTTLRNPKTRVTAAQMEIMSSVAMQELDDEALGWFSRKLPWGTYGMLCRASLTSPDLGVALKRWCRHHRLLTDDIELHFSTSNSIATFSITTTRDLGPMTEFCLVSSLRYLLGYACWAIDSNIHLQEATFPFAPPPHRECYPLLFSGAVRFNAERASFSFHPQYLALPIKRDEQDLRLMLQRALPLTVLQYRRDRLLVQRVRQFLRTQLPASATAEAVAAALNMSPRTLYRQLGGENASLQHLKDEVRRERAIELLTRTRQPIKHLAQSVGFRNEKSFSRAFRLWTGQSPAAFRGARQVID